MSEQKETEGETEKTTRKDEREKFVRRQEERACRTRRKYMAQEELSCTPATPSTLCSSTSLLIHLLNLMPRCSMHHIVQRLLPNMPADLPSSKHMSLLKHLLDLLQRPARRLRETEEHVQEGGEVERSEDEVRLVGDGGETRGNTEGERHVEGPVRGGGDGDGFGTNTHGEDFGGVGPGDGADGDGETGFE